MQKIGIMKTPKPFQCIAVAALGGALVLVGVIGLFLLPGGFLIVAGALMLSARCVWFRRALEKSQARFPFVEHTFMWLSACWETCRRRFSNPGDPGSQFGA